ncbi:unnamed protein product [Dovyalis caffra]|uniref:MSP domain-containing protein n=1 Tax=Dovyalis caffra TaxID=77055 RepID=A0AAV1RCX7_9ROSI|nr:unnamed protein product [Dovyalis caffra]
MTTELLEIQPRELMITFEVKKQSSCSIQLGNKSDQYVAFKVKTTSPKKYCVRPNTGVIKPKAACDFTVTMQAQKVDPPDLQCKDKFLVQSTVVPFGTTEEDITSDIFSKESGNYIEEKKLKPPNSPVLLPSNGELKKDPCYDISFVRDIEKDDIENIPRPYGLAQEDVVFETAKDADELGAAKDSVDSIPADTGELNSSKDTAEPKLMKDFEELKSKLHAMDLKLKEADRAIMKLTEENRMATKEKNKLKHEARLFTLLPPDLKAMQKFGQSYQRAKRSPLQNSSPFSI